MSSFRLMWFAFDAYFKCCVNIVIDGAWIKERVPGGCCIGGFSGYGPGPVLRRCSDAWQVVTTVHSTVSLTDILIIFAQSGSSIKSTSGYFDVFSWFVMYYRYLVILLS